MKIGLFSYGDSRRLNGRVQQKVWVYKGINESEVVGLSEGAGISRLLSKLFVSRGITDIEYVKGFIKPDIGRMHNPFRMDGMEAAVSRIVQAVENREKILVYGDYDVDGVTSTSILYLFLGSLGAVVQYFVPDRMEDGYGLTMKTAEMIKTLDVSLVITVDCGITSVDEVRTLQDAGLQVIVTDHHECREILPEAIAVLNPQSPAVVTPSRSCAGPA